MSTAIKDAARWSRERWAGVVLAIFIAHLGALFLLSSRHEATPNHAEAHSSVRWLTSSDVARKALDSLLDNDPTLLATVNPRGFSGAAWLRPPALAFRPGEWSDTDRSLPQLTRPLGAAVQAATTSANDVVLDPARKPTTPAPVPAVTQPALRTASRLLITGPLASRRLLQTVPLKSWPLSDLLADTRVEVLVSREGLVFSRRLASGGLKNPVQQTADRDALALTTGLRFEPLPKSVRAGDDSLTEGTLVFQWHTIEPAAATTKKE